MAMALDEIEAAARALPPEARAGLVERLAESLAVPPNSAAHNAWVELAKKRRDEFRSGQTAGIPGEEGSSMVRKLVGR